MKFLRNWKRWRRNLAQPYRLPLLSISDFRQEIRSERLRVERRGIPFCLLKVTLIGSSRTPNELRRFVKLILGNVRATDERGWLGRFTVGLLLVDTPEMGGRCVLDRLERLAIDNRFESRFELQVFDPEGMGSDDWRSNGDDSGIHRIEKAHPTDLVRPAVLTAMGSPAVGAQVTASSSNHRRTDVLEAMQSYKEQSVTRLALKRGVDVAGAAVGLVFATPILLGAMAAIRLTSSGPAMFTQLREGRGGRAFRIYKLRTMYQDAEAKQAALRELSERDGPAFKLKNDPRVTPVGKFLRATCIDELPQLINVLLGDMSIVGPRPLPVSESRACEHWQRRRLDVRPGMTCHWQINKHKVETFDQWMRLDLAYVDRGSLWTDLVLMARTLAVPVARRGGD